MAQTTNRLRFIASALAVLLAVGGWVRRAEAQIAVPLTFTDLGLGDRVELAGLTASQTFVIADNRDANATTLTGRAMASLDATRARLEVVVAGVTAQVLDVASGPNGMPFSVSLAGATRSDRGTLVEFRSSIDPTDAFCRGQYRIPTITLDRLNVAYTQSSTPPSDIASFAPPILRVVGLWVPPTVTDQMSTAVLRVAAGLVRRAGAVPLRVELHTSTSETELPTTEYNPFRRDIVFRSAAATNISVLPTTFADGHAGAPVLVLGGEHVIEQADVVNSELSRVLVTDESGAVGAASAAVLPQREQRLTDLGLSTTSATGTGKVRLGLTIPQAAFGGMTKAITLRVSGRHTPVARTSAASVSVFVNNALVSSSRTTSRGTFDLKPIVVEPTLNRDNRVEIVAEERADHSFCSADALPFELQVSTDSTAEATMGPSLPISFRRLPQAFLPSTDVALVDTTPATLATAVAVLAGFQRLTTQPINVQVRSISAIGRSPRPALVVAHGGPISGITRKLTPGAGDLTIADIKNRRVTLTTEVATLQVIEEAQRMVVIADGPTGDHTLQLVQQIAAEPNGFGSLGGDVILRSSDGRLIRAQFSDDRPVATTEPAPAAPWKWVALSAAGIVIAFVFAVGLSSRRRLRARRRA